jgi:hypothetical protein
MNWDFIIGLGVIILIILVVWARVSKQSIKEVILDIKDLLSGGAEEVQEKADEVIMYE